MAVSFLICMWLSLYSIFTVPSSATIVTPKFPASIFRPQMLTAVSNTKNQLYETRYFTQTLDHFNFRPESYETFQQRYLINDKHWGGTAKNSPIFAYMGNEGDIEWFAQNTGFMFESAPHFKALLIFIEHRFYGRSNPFGGDANMAYNSSRSLGYLSSAQALADYATLITELKKNLTATDSPVIVFGGSYGGMLAAWFRLKYPHVAIGALASSAPILHFDRMVSPYSFYDRIAQDFKSESENCYKVIKGSWQLIDDKASQDGGLDDLRRSFRICNKHTEARRLKSWLSTAFIYAAMTDYPTSSNFLTALPAYPVKHMCRAIDGPTAGKDAFASLYGAANIFYNSTGDATCFDPDDNSHLQSLGTQGWSWQACVEMVMPLAIGEHSMFPASEWDYGARAKACEDAYGVQPRPHWISTEFGGHHIERVLKRFGSNIIFFNGLRDPWSSGGVLKNISDSIIAIVAKEGAHHVDLRYSTLEDPSWLRAVRQREGKIIEGWLTKYHVDLSST